ncbi:MAG: aminoglycoside phosphotransferase family protein [Chloroflexota bacterium]
MTFQQSPPRLARLVLVTPDGEVVGALPPLMVDTPWWQDAEPVVRAAREQYHIDVTILRLLEADLAVPPGGAVTYLAEVARRIVSEPWPGTLDDHPLRMPWARPGGPSADVAWAESLLDERGMRRIGPAQQVRSWNLSSLWRLPVEGQTAWLKCVPPFFAHEGRILERLQGGPVPTLISHDGQRLLMAEIPGDDLYDASMPQLMAMVRLLVALQRQWLDRTDELLALYLPDWRAPSLAEAIAGLLERVGPGLRTEDRATLDGFVVGLEERLTQVANCGLPDTVVHGDFHPGNVRGDDTALVLLDWGDCGVGHPLLDQPAFLDRVPADAVETVRRHWHTEWTRALPGSDPDRASMLLRPVAAARQALVYQNFLDNIEPSEQPYHAADPTDWLVRAVELIRGAA